MKEFWINKKDEKSRITMGFTDCNADCPGQQKILEKQQI
jgi:hypothetical protein